MITGRDTLQEISRHVQQAQTQIGAADKEADELKTQLSRMRLEENEQYQKLAEFRLDDIRSGAVTSRLDIAHRAVLAFIEQHRQALSTVETDITQAQENLHMLEQQRETGRSRRDSALEALADQIELSKAAIEKTAAYREQKDNAVAADEVARRADEKAARSEADLDRKGEPYREDDLFMYLWQRRYLTPDYRYGGITRMLDGWVARLIDFKKTRVDYHMLNELPRGLRTHAAKAADKAEEQHRRLVELERQAAERDGVPALQDALDTAEKQLQKINDDIKVREDEYQRLLSKRNAFSAGDDEYSQKALSMLAAELESKDTIELFEQARRTPRPEDDAVVARLRQLQQTQENLHNRIAELKAVQEQQRQALKELAELRDKFRRRNYDARYSSFPTDLGIGVILGEILRGGRSSGSAWERIGRSQRWEFPKGHRRSRGGFGGYGGMGSGGGFRTGGSF